MLGIHGLIDARSVGNSTLLLGLHKGIKMYNFRRENQGNKTSFLFTAPWFAVFNYIEREAVMYFITNESQGIT